MAPEGKTKRESQYLRALGDIFYTLPTAVSSCDPLKDLKEGQPWEAESHS